MQPRRHVAPVADAPMDEGEMQDRIEWRAIGVALKLADRRLDRKAGDPLDQFLARLPIGDEIGDRNALELVPVGERLDLRPDHDRPVVVGKFADDGDRRQPGELAEVDRGLGMARAHQHAPILCDQRKDVARTDEIARAHVAIGERAHGVRALLGRYAGGEAMPHVHRDGEGGAERGVVDRHHRVQIQPPRLIAGQRRADDAAAVADDERHLLGGAERGGNDKIALVLAVVVIGDDDDLAAGESLYGVGDGIEHVQSIGRRRRGVKEIIRRHRAAASRRRCARRSRATARTPCSRQISVTAPGETPIRRAKSARDTPFRLIQSPSFMSIK